MGDLARYRKMTCDQFISEHAAQFQHYKAVRNGSTLMLYLTTLIFILSLIASIYIQREDFMTLGIITILFFGCATQLVIASISKNEPSMPDITRSQQIAAALYFITLAITLTLTFYAEIFIYNGFSQDIMIIATALYIGAVITFPHKTIRHALLALPIIVIAFMFFVPEPYQQNHLLSFTVFVILGSSVTAWFIGFYLFNSSVRNDDYKNDDSLLIFKMKSRIDEDVIFSHVSSQRYVYLFVLTSLLVSLLLKNGVHAPQSNTLLILSALPIFVLGVIFSLIGIADRPRKNAEYNMAQLRLFSANKHIELENNLRFYSKLDEVEEHLKAVRNMARPLLIGEVKLLIKIGEEYSTIRALKDFTLRQLDWNDPDDIK